MATNKPAASTAHQHRSPVKGILKTSKSFEKHETPGINKSTKFDEINVQLTHHPADKDYGHMKINEPKTPFHYEHDVNVDELDANLLAEKLQKTLTHSQFIDQSLEEDSEDEDQIIETEEELQKRKDFERRRKLHYNEFEAVLRARQLMEQDEDEDERIEVDESSPSAK
ncbi:protein phosphatase inhibitor 2-like [Contarinia nasturtii]|uniref:protein phosphatase inhibitor 2-like n=1 Tax=Contarinia nasturtii TaxID=265458 RepID=UPI0012D47CDD|nr:protein phosphatase inhibitor 2-like [Contarinia nasturtii]